MVTPTVPEGTPKTDRVLLWRTVFFTVLIFALLQVRHPFFTMTDDNLSGGYPFLSEIGHHLLKGESPWYSDHLFGGNYNLLRDAQYFSWHPFYLLTSLLVATPFRLCILDTDALFLYLLAATGFVSLAVYLRKEGILAASDGWILFCTLSYTFTMMALVTCASWLTFENNAGALPWLTLGIFQKQWRWGIGIVTLFSVHQILGGHPEPLVTSSMFLSFFAVGISWWRGSVQPLAQWLIGYALAVIIVLPLLIPMVEGFMSCGRAGGTSLSDMQDNNIPASCFASSFFLGTAMAYFEHPDGDLNGIYIFCLGASAAAWCFIPVLSSRAKWRYLEVLCFGMLAFAILLVTRPVIVSEIMLHLPIFKSMRWPFREMVQLQFFFHLLLVLRPMTCSRKNLLRTVIGGSVIFAVPMLLNQVTPSFNDMPQDRKVILSGRLDPYWAEIGTLLKPEDRYVVLIPEKPTQTDSMTVPYSLIGGYNYAMITGIVSASGYSQTPPAGHVYLRTPLAAPWGGYLLTQRDALLKERPDLKFISVEQMHPLKVTLSSRDGPTTDLTPYILKALSGP